ncbi:MAG TPA: nuclear transport factor 2 family protein, partial [Thermoplasmata archaeon]|nr:nuclear transport factor 2 family protein [Thermoplasmata archaeon]
MTADEKVRERVIDVLNRLSEGYSKRDFDGIVALMDLGLMGFGTGADERVSGVEEFRSRLERDLSQCDEMSLYYSNVDVDGEGAVAWLACDCRAVVVVRGISQEIKFRLTAVLR